MRREEFIIPNKDFIIALFNVKPDSIENFFCFTDNDVIHYHISLYIEKYECDICGGKCISHGKKEKLIHHPNIIDFDGVIHYQARRYICKDCHHTFFEKNPFSFSGFSNSFALINRIMKHLANLDLTFKRIAQLTNVSDTTVQLYLDSYVSLPKPSLPENIGIDELYSKKMSTNNSSYLCILVDNINRYPFEILCSRSKRYLDSHFSSYPKAEKARVKYVTIDMWLPYKDIALKHFPNCKVAVDPFHVVENICKAFTKIRVSIMNQVPYGSDAYYLLKTWHKLLDSDKFVLDNEPKYNSHFNRKLNYRSLYNMLLDISDRLKEAYQLKCAYQLFNERANIHNCEAWLDQLIKTFTDSDIVEYYDCTKTIINWRQEIINSFERPYNERKQSNALSENINSQIRAYLGLIRGSSNFNRFKKRILLATNKKVFYAISDRLESEKRKGYSRGKYTKK
jgi:Transposase and inactivated derivatives